jgi:type IV pilus assembly protein PilQ
MRTILRSVFCATLLFAPLSAQEIDTTITTLPSGANQLTSLNFKDTDIRDIFRALSLQHNLNIFVDNSVTKRITIALQNVRAYDAIRFICEENRLNLTLEGGIFKVSNPPPPMVEPPPVRIPFVYYEDGLLSVQFKNDDLEQCILRIQEKSGKNILITSGTKGALNGSLNDVEFDIGFTQILNNNGFAVQQKNGIYVVSRLDYFVGSQGEQKAQAGPYWISVRDSLVTLDVTNAPIERVLSDMIRQLNTDVVFYNTVQGSVTARATSIPLPRALDLILRNTNYGFRQSEGIYFVGEKTNKALVETKLIKLKYLRSEKLLEMIPQSITSLATLKVMKEHNGIVAVAPTDVIGQLEEYLAQIDQPVAQVLIEAIVVDYDLSRGLELGVEAGGVGSGDTVGVEGLPYSIIPGLDVTFSGNRLNRALKDIGSINLFGTDLNVANLGKLPSNFYLNLKALEQQGVANIKSRPLIATINGHQASLSIGTTQYFLLKTTTPYRDPTQVIFQETQTFQTIEADVKLEITPYVGSDGLITVEIKPDFRTPVGQLSAEVPPTINRRALSSAVIMREGETIMLGGLVQESESEIRSQVPILGSIPLLGALFSSTSTTTRKSELIIYVTPHISYGEEFQNVYLPGRE